MAKSNAPQKPAAAETAATEVATDTPGATGQLQQDGQGTAGSGTDAGQAAAVDPMKAYIVGSVPIRHDGEYFGLGARIELTDSDALRLGGLVTIAPLDPDTKE